MSKFSKMQDSELLKKISEGSVVAYEEIFRRHYSAVLHFLGGVLKDMAVVEDLAQDIFMKLWLRREELSGVRSLKDYLFIASRNAAMSVLRSRRSSEEGLDVLSEDRAGARATTSDRAEYASTRRVLTQAMDTLPQVRGEVFRLSREQNLSNSEIASRMGLSVRTVEKHISLALRDLRAKIN